MLRRTLLAALLLCAAGCGPTTTEPARVDAAGAALDGDTPPSDTTTVASDTTHRGGGTIGSGT